MKKLGIICVSLLLTIFWLSNAWAHFGVIIPSKSAVVDKKDASLNFDIAFVHPMERNGMEMAKPKSFKVYVAGKSEDILANLVPNKFWQHQAWKASYKLAKPGVYQFAVEPEPYFEPAEDCFIIHYTKTIIPAYGEEEGWDQPLGLKTEIVPLTRPFGNYAGNVFQGQVLLDGKPKAGTTVEVEYYNRDGQRLPVNDYYVTQVVKTDPNGIFTFAVPWAGYWGFAALNTSETKLEHQGQAKEVELGAVLWLEFANPKLKGQK